MPASRDHADETRRVELPDETGPVPVSHVRAEPRWFGVPPPVALVLVTGLAFILAIALFAAGSWPFGLIFLGLTAFLGAALLELARRRPWEPAVTARAWLGPRFELLWARSRAIAEAERVRAGRAVVESERRAVRLRLAEAERSGDEEAAAAAKARLEELARAEAALDGRLEERRALSDERIRRVRMSIDQTLVVGPEDDSRRPAA
jgi:hypothetical protein